MKYLILLAVFGIVFFALYQKWRSIPPQTKQMWAMLFGAAKMARQAKKRMREQAGVNPTQTESSSGASPFDFPYPNQQTTASSTGKAVYKMQACQKCGLHVPENEGVMVRGQFYCCAEHAQ